MDAYQLLCLFHTAETQSLHLNTITDISRIIALLATSDHVVPTKAFIFLQPAFTVPSESVASQICIFVVESLPDLLITFRVGL